MQLKTERLSIRPFEVEDKEDIFEYPFQFAHRPASFD